MDIDQVLPVYASAAEAVVAGADAALAAGPARGVPADAAFTVMASPT